MIDMTDKKTGFVFQGAGVETYKNMHHIYNLYNHEMKQKLDIASEITGLQIDRTSFDDVMISDHDMLYYHYALSCCVADIYRSMAISSEIHVGYSLGVYSALYAADAIDFATGLLLLVSLNEVTECLRQQNPAMASIVGLSEEAITCLAAFQQYDLDIANNNSQSSYIVSGNSTGIQSLVNEAELKGAIVSKALPIYIPYHSSITQKQKTIWKDEVDKFKFSEPNVPVLSTHSCDMAMTVDGCKKLIVESFCTRFNWYESIRYLDSIGVNTLFECGSGMSLSKLGGFLEFDQVYYNVKDLYKYARKH